MLPKLNYSQSSQLDVKPKLKLGGGGFFGKLIKKKHKYYIARQPTDNAMLASQQEGDAAPDF